jgi:N-acetylglucosamine kinase-like BadF-type ATPase
LQGAVLNALRLDASAPTHAVTAAVYQRQPVSLAELAPLVTAAATSGDPVAEAILDRAAALLLESLATVHARAGSPQGQPAVLGGGVLLTPGRLRDTVHEGTARLGLRPELAADAAAGAAALAIRALTDRPLAGLAHGCLVAPGSDGDAAGRDGHAVSGDGHFASGDGHGGG